MIERLSDFTRDGGVVIQGQPQPGDVIRIDGAIEQRLQVYAPYVPSPIVQSKRIFLENAATALGANGAGRADLGKIIRNMRASVDDEVYVIAERYNSAETLDKAQVAGLTAILVSKSIMTTQQRTAILAAWPEA